MRAGVIIVFVVLAAFCCLLYFRLSYSPDSATSAPARTLMPLPDPPTATAILTRCADMYKTHGQSCSYGVKLSIIVESQPPFERKFSGTCGFLKSSGYEGVFYNESGDRTGIMKIATGRNFDNIDALSEYFSASSVPQTPLIQIIPWITMNDYNDYTDLGLFNLELIEENDIGVNYAYGIRAGVSSGGIISLFILKDTFSLWFAERVIYDSASSLKTIERVEFDRCF